MMRSRWVGWYVWTFLCCLVSVGLHAQAPETMASGSFIINMGITPQTNNNALRPYGLIYDLTKNYQVPIKWVINPGKAKDGADFTYNSVTYRGGTFIIPAEFRTTTVNTRIAFWQSQGVVGVTTTSPVTVPVYATIRSAVRWTLDLKNGKIAEPFFARAGIPVTAYDKVLPSTLGACNDIFVMPHAEPTAATHGNLVTWNNLYDGAIWVGCKAGSETENNVGNFLSSAGLVPTSHDDLIGGASYDYPADPIMQFLGTTMHLVTQNGAEQIYIPAPTWRPTTKVGVYQTTTPNPSTRRALIAYGRGFGEPNRGWVMMNAGHNIAKDNGPDNVAAIRAFFNFSLLTAIERTVTPSLSAIPDTIPAGTGTIFSYTLTPPGGTFSTQWASSCGGTFTPNATSATVTYTPPVNATSCIISVSITDACGRVFFDSKMVKVGCTLTVGRTVTPVTCNGGSNGAINMTISGGAGPYSWNWSRVSPAGINSGTGTTIDSLSAGTYDVTVTSSAGCSATFSSLVSQPNPLTATPNVVNYLCFGQTGAINLTVSGGTPGYTYSWTGPGGFTASTKDIGGLLAGGYQVTVTDASNCTGTAMATVTGPASAVAIALDSKSNVTCHGAANGSIAITASGGTPGYTYLWSDGSTNEDRTGLGPGTYVVTVTDANGCTAVRTEVITQPQPLTIAVQKTDPTCPPGAVSPVNSDGAIDITVSGGTAPYIYNWADLVPPPAEPQDRTGLPVGTYSLTVTDTNSCTAMVNVVLTNTNNLPPVPININN